MGMLDGKIGLVTGAGSGIGKACAQAMAREGAKVVVADVKADTAQSAASEIASAGGTALGMVVDVADPGSVESMVAATIEAYGGLHLAVNNAGIGGPAELTGDYPLDGWRQVMSINLDGVFYSMRHELPEIVKAGGGSIVNISSILGLVGWGTAVAYVSAKHGVVGLTKTAALEYAQQGVRVNSVNPGFIATPLLTNAGIEQGSDLYDFIASKHAMNRLGMSEEVAEAVVWLLSDAAAFVTGVALPVDGGYLAQ